MEKTVAEQDRDQALATVRGLENALNVREERVQERNVRLEAIYASLTWKLYRGYAILTHALRQRANELWRSVCVLRK
jgi:hypothetical protein